MRKKKMGFFRGVLTERNNVTFEITRVLFLVAVVSVLVFAAYDLFVLGHAFDPFSYCGGLGGLLFGGGSGVALKARAE